MIHWHYLAWAAAAICLALALLGYFGASMASRAVTRDDLKFPRMCLLAAAILIILTLSACAHDPVPPEPIIRTVEVQVPVDDPACAREAEASLVDNPPDYPDTDQALREAPNLFERVKLLLAGRIMRAAREDALNEAISSCAAGD